MAYQYKREPLPPEEANRLVNACDTHQEKLVIWTLLDTGLRVSELASLTRKDIDWQSTPLRIVVHGKGGPYGKQSKRRVVPLAARRSRALLEGHFAIHDALGMTARTLHRVVRRVARRAGLTRKTSPHVLRHTFSVDSIRKGVSLPALQKVLGHDHLTTTQIYLNMSPEDVLREYENKW
jgi:integrase/recombinase XerD